VSIESADDLLDIVETLAGITTDNLTVTYSGGSFTAIFDRPYAAVQPGDIDLETRQPVLIARTADVAALAKGTVLTVQGDAYKLRHQEPDGTGLTRILLKV
jgi:hypothetical protein